MPPKHNKTTCLCTGEDAVASVPCARPSTRSSWPARRAS
jgi:hypothetical protein